MADEMPADSPEVTATPVPVAGDAHRAGTDVGVPDAGRSGPDAATPDMPGQDGRAVQVTRSVDLDVGVDDVWRAVSDPGERSLWLDDPDATARHVRVDEIRPGERLVWTWWHPEDQDGASTVAVVLRPVDGGGTRVVVTETLPAPSPRGGGAFGGAAFSGAALGGAASVRAVAGRPVRARAVGSAWVRCAGIRWDRRALGLELLFVAPRVAVA